jgi:hypothetical protein
LSISVFINLDISLSHSLFREVMDLSGENSVGLARASSACVASATVRRGAGAALANSR